MTEPAPGYASPQVWAGWIANAVRDLLTRVTRLERDNVQRQTEHGAGSGGGGGAAGAKLYYGCTVQATIAPGGSGNVNVPSVGVVTAHWPTYANATLVNTNPCRVMQGTNGTDTRWEIMDGGAC